MPVEASTHPEWIAHYLLTTTFYPLPWSLTSALSYFFPANAQAFYDAVLEELLGASSSRLRSLKNSMHDGIAPLVVALVDIGCAAGFGLYSLASGETALTLLLVTAALLKANRK